MNNLSRDLIIAQACEAARNPHADILVNAAHGDLIDAAISNQPPAWSLHPSAGQFKGAAEFLKTLASKFDDLLYQVAREAAFNASNNITIPKTLFSDALHDSGLLVDLEEAGERLIENAREREMV